MTVEPRYEDAATIRALLNASHTIAVVGLSSDPSRASHGVAAYLKDHGYRIVPVNPREAEVLGEKAYPSLGAIPFPVDLVDVFRRAEEAPAIAREAVAIGARGLWLQQGIVSAEAAAIAAAGGLAVVMDRCLAVEHAAASWARHAAQEGPEGPAEGAERPEA